MILESRQGREVMTARKSTFSTQAKAAAACHMTAVTYGKKERDQRLFTFEELKALYDVLGDDGKDTLADYVGKNFARKLRVK